MGILVSLILLGVLIFVHELGHFVVAKACGVGVMRFSIGFGPRLWAIHKGETEYALSLVPLGGYVKMVGEDPDEEVPEDKKGWSFYEKPLPVRVAVVGAGPLFNLLFAFVVMTGLYLWGVPVLEPVLGKVMPGSPAQVAGLLPGDRILSIQGHGVSSWEAMAKWIRQGSGKRLKLLVDREGKRLELTIVPTPRKVKDIFGETKVVGRIGVVAAGVYRIERSDPLRAVVRGWEYTCRMVYLTLLGIIKILQRVVPARSVGGPILIVQIASQQVKAGLVSLCTFMAFISINLGIINLFPIPILDGGHLLFFGVEAIRRRPLSGRAKELAQQVGLAIIIAIMALAFYNDIMRILGGGK